MEQLNMMMSASEEDLIRLKAKLNSATEELGKLSSKNEQYKVFKKDFCDNVITALKEAFPKEDLKREERVVKGLFNKIIDAKLKEDTKDKDNYLVAGYLRKKVEEMVMLIYAFRYLKYDEITKMFESYGIKLDYEPIEKHLPYLSGANFKDSVKEYIENAIELKNSTDVIKTNIDENIYGQLPSTLKYHKAANPTGLKKGMFRKFSFMNLLKKLAPFKALRKYDNMVEETQKRDKADTFALSIADTLISDVKQDVNQSNNQ